MKNKHKKGFTLIEVIIYIALFSILLGTGFAAAYQLITGSSSLSAKNITVEEGDFILRKISWALTGAQSINTPSSGTPLSDTLVVNKYDGSTVTFRLRDNKIEMKESAGDDIFIPITTENVFVSNLQFNYLSQNGITATATIDGADFIATKYMRQ
jgi:prepilin-type N-terminal cleavage/methylation domain-containing protein